MENKECPHSYQTDLGASSWKTDILCLSSECFLGSISRSYAILPCQYVFSFFTWPVYWEIHFLLHFQSLASCAKPVKKTPSCSPGLSTIKNCNHLNFFAKSLFGKLRSKPLSRPSFGANRDFGFNCGSREMCFAAYFADYCSNTHKKP